MKRLQFEIPDDRAKEIDDLVQAAGFTTRVQLFNAAISLFEWAINERNAGNTIASLNEETNKFKELVMPGLPAKKARAKRMPPEMLRFDEAFGAELYRADLQERIEKVLKNTQATLKSEQKSKGEHK